MSANAAYGREANTLPPAFTFKNCIVSNPLDNIGGPWVGDPPPFTPWTIPYAPLPNPTPTVVTVGGGTTIGPLFPTAKEFRELEKRVEALERELAEPAEQASEPLRAEDV